MSDAKTRAEARRQAILGRGSDRLAKLTSSARGEDATNIYDDPPLPTLPSREPSPFVQASHHAMPAFPSPPPAVDDDAAAALDTPFAAPVLTLVRMVSTPLLVFSFIFWLEPRKYNPFNIQEMSLAAWGRWSDLAQSPDGSPAGIEHMPLWWTLLTLQTTMYALQLVLNPRASQPPTFLNLVLPHLPNYIAAALRSGFAYAQIASFLLDDLAFAIFIVGVVVWASGR